VRRRIGSAGGPPSWVAGFNPIAKLLLAAGVPILFNALVTIRGRKTGLARTTPLAVITVSDRRWVWSPWGESNWVRNLRAAGRATVTARRRKEEVAATELDPTQRVGFFRDILGPVALSAPFGAGVWFIRIVDGVDLDHPSEAATGRPVFELHSLRAAQHPYTDRLSARLTGQRGGHRSRVPVGLRVAKWFLLVAWLGLVVVAAPLAGKLSGVETNDSNSYLPEAAESTRVLALQRSLQPTDTQYAVVIYERTSGITAADRSRAASDAASCAAVVGVAGPVKGPIASADGKALQLMIPVAKGPGGWNDVAGTVKAIRAITGGGGGGLSVRVTGQAGFTADTAAAFNGLDSTLLYAALAVVVVLLLLTYRSPLLWLLPVMAVAVALTVAQAAVYLLAEAGLTVNSQSASLLTVLVFGVGTDYALLLVARYREELRRHQDRHQAMSVAIRRAGPAIVASAATVAVAMLCLTVAEANSTKGMGPVAAVGVGIGLLAMISLLPALLLVFGRWVFWPVRPVVGSAEPGASNVSGLWWQVGRVIARRPRVIWVTTLLIFGGLSLGLTDLKADGIPVTDSFVTKPESVLGAQTMAAHFPAGGGAPVVIVGATTAADRLHDVVATTDGIAGVDPPVTAGDIAFIQATLADPPTSLAAQEAITRVRAAVREVAGAGALVGGPTATLLDVNDATRHDNNLIMPLVLAIVALIFGVLLRSVVAPLVLIGTVVLSFSSALGVSALMFDQVFGWAGADTSLPLFVFVFLVALGSDYNIFLMTRVREEAGRLNARRGALVGLAVTGGVITSAGLVLAGTFAVLGILPVIAYAEIGIAISLGVLLDTFVVRSVLVTAISLDLGRWMWWPSRLSRAPDQQFGEDRPRRELEEPSEPASANSQPKSTSVE
jgi:putative drug exporter of the RND superfamily